MAPIAMFAPNANGTISLDTLLISSNAINGDHDPTINPALYENPAALLRITVGNLSEKNAGTGPDAVETTNAKTITDSSNHWCFSKINPANGIETRTDAAQKIMIAFFLPIFCESHPVAIIPIHDDVVANIMISATLLFSNPPN